MYQAIDVFYEQNKDVLFTTLKPSKSVVKDVEKCFDNFKSYWAKGHSVVAKENVPDVIGKNVDENTRNQNIRVMQEFGYIVSNDGRNDYSFTKTFIDLCKSSQPLGVVVLDALYAIDGLDGLTMYLNYLLCTLREAYTFGNVVLFPDSKEKFSRLVPDKDIRDKYRKRVYDFYGFIGDTRQRPNPLTTDEYTPNASYMSRAELENLKLLVKGNKENGLDTLVLTTNGHHLLQQIDENLSHNSKIRTHMNLTPSTYIKKIDPIIFYGAPGTGKTSYVQNNIFNFYHPDNRFFLTFHQSFSYEEFVEGLKPVLDNTSKDVKYHIEKGVFYKACERAAIMAGYNNLKDCLNDSVGGRKIKFDAAISERKTIVLCIDEINRGNVASIFGDLISLIEPSKRLGAGVFEMTAILPYSQEEFGVPANLFIVGTMNTADRSIQLLDSALRRRFKFEELLPSYQNFKNQDAASILQKINANIRCLLNKDSQIGHSYLMNATSSKEILSVILNKIIPLLEEYFYDDIKKVRFILNENDSTTYPFYIKDDVAKEAYTKYINQNDIEDEDREFYILNPDIEELLKLEATDDIFASTNNEKCKNYLLHLLGESEKSEQEQLLYMSNKNNTTITYEFGTLYIEGQAHKEGDTPLDKVTFKNLWDFILANKSGEDVDVIMSVHTRGGRQYIKTGRYVGTIQTRNGHTIEILPKIYKASGQQEKDKDVCRSIFLNMLRHFTDIKARSFQNVTLSTQKGFPILEVYISNYINAVEQLVLGGLKKNYAPVEENQRFLKGKLDITKQITRNVANKARFAIRYNKYIEDIPQNRVIVTTLRKLMGDSYSTTNKAHITALLTILADIPSSTNIENDLRIASTSNRLFTSYDMLIKWSKQFLLNRGFTTFAGSYVNQSLLFQAERLFEDFVAYLFRKYAPTYNVDAQNTRYFLVDRHNGKRMFQLRPDILVETDKNSPRYECIIIDTKWKAIDASRPDRHYLIDMKDMYQLYAYGQKYRQGQSKEVGLDVIPKLVLVYPYSEKFTEYLPEFVYEDIKEKIGLKLMVVPFDLTNPSTYERQIHNIIHCLDVKPEIQPIYRYEYDWEDNTIPLVAAEPTPHHQQTMLVGCYRSKAHLEWIKQNNLYNIRLGSRSGAISKSGLVVSASRLLLYDSKNPKEYQVFELDSSNHIIAKNDLMKSKGYPDLKPDREYLLYVITEESGVKPHFDVESLRQTYAPKLKKGSPFFVTI